VLVVSEEDQAEIAEDERILVRKEHIAWFDISMDDSLVVQFGHRRRNWTKGT